MSEYQTDLEYRAAKNEIANALAAFDRFTPDAAKNYLEIRMFHLNDEQWEVRNA